MEVFSTVVVELSTNVSALLPVENFDYERHKKIRSDDSSSEYCAELATNHRVKFLKEKLKDLNVNVVVSEKPADTESSLKLCGGWSDICAVRVWLLQLIRTTESMQSVNNKEQLDTGAKRETAVTKRCTATFSDRPRRSLRNCHMAKQDCNEKEMFLSTVTSPKRIKAKQLKRSNIQMKKTKELLSDDKGNSDTNEGMSESYADRNTEVATVVNGSLAPIMVFTDKQNVTENSVMDNDIEVCIQTLIGSADGISVACSELQLKEAIDVNESDKKPTSEKLKCDSCDYITTKRRYLLMHVARTHGDRSYVCPTCSRTFAIAKDLNHHLKCHTEQYCCELCGRTLKSKYTVALHVARVHKGVAPRPVKRYLCTLCGKMCRNKTEYNVHRNKEHTGIRPFHCDLCDASFFARANLRAHRQVLLFNIVRFVTL